MNRRIQKKKAKQLLLVAADMKAQATSLRESTQRLRPTGPITEALRQRALFRARRYEAEAVELAG